MHWIAASLISAVFLGVYQLFKKHAVHHNAVFPVLFLGTLSSAIVWLLIMLVQYRLGGVPPALTVAPLTFEQHGKLFLKAVIVGSSWVCAYFALKHLPVSIASPISSTGPLWTLAGALVILAERPSLLQFAGIAITLASFFMLSLAGTHEGIHFHRNRWVWYMVVSAVLGGVSGLYDKYLLGRQGFAASTVQAWFSIYLTVLFLPLALGWKFRWWPRGEFHWRWSIPMIGLTLLFADFIYFNALRDPHALVSLVSSIRRGSALVAFCGGPLFFHERNARRKVPAVLGILAGITLTVLG